MKQIFIIILVFIHLVIRGATYYVATDGDDDNPGTLVEPWATWDKAFSSRIAGDTVYFRGGVYYSSSSVKHKGSGGTEQNPVCYFAFPDDYINGNFPILDGINKTTPSSGIEIHYNSGYIKLKGLVVRNNKQIQINYRYAMGFYLFQSSNVTFENCVSHSNGWCGFKFQTCNNILLINCDSYDNCDDLTQDYEGGHSDGFIFYDTHGVDMNDTLASVALKNCRAWNNSDDGFDLETEGYIQADNCWSWANGRLKGDGDGFKTGLAAIQTLNVRVKITRSIAAHNKFNGFDSNDNNHAGRGLHFFNNLSFNNGFAGFWALNTSSSDIYEIKRVYRNNIGFNNKQGNFIAASGASTDNLYNSWNSELNVTVNQSDFTSLDTAQLRYPRKPDGSLPDITFGKLFESSDLIDAGTDVGLDYNNDAPDLGYYEYPTFPETSAPYINTNEPIITRSRDVTAGGNMIYDGGGTISSKGVCISREADPDISDTVIYAGTGTADFTIRVPNLTKSTTYHVRAYATNETGTAYGADVEFTTPASSPVRVGSKLLKHGNYYIKIE